MKTKFSSIKLIDSITRPANATQYTAGDVISDATNDAHFDFNNTRGLGSKADLKGSIDYATMIIESNQGTKPDIELWLFDQDIAAVADNGVFAPSDTEIANFIGKIDFGVSDWDIGLSGVGNAGNIVQAKPNVGIIIPATAGNIYGQLVVRNAYTPISGEIFHAHLVMTLD